MPQQQQQQRQQLVSPGLQRNAHSSLGGDLRERQTGDAGRCGRRVLAAVLERIVRGTCVQTRDLRTEAVMRQFEP